MVHDDVMGEMNKRQHASKWSLVVGLVILVTLAMSCRNNGDEGSSSRDVLEKRVSAHAVTDPFTAFDADGR